MHLVVKLACALQANLVPLKPIGILSLITQLAFQPYAFFPQVSDAPPREKKVSFMSAFAFWQNAPPPW